MGMEIFTPADIRGVVKSKILPALSQIDDSQLAGLILTQDVHTIAKPEYHNGYPCLLKVGRGLYKFVGFSH